MTNLRISRCTPNSSLDDLMARVIGLTTRLPIWGGFVPLLVIVLCSCATSGQAQEMDLGHEGLPVTGDSVPELQSFEQAVRALLSEHEVPGASLAVARNGRVIFARGYGWADTSARVPVSPRHRFRIASVSKPVTAIAVLQLISEGRLSLDDRPFEIFAAAGLIDERLSDPRILQVTVRHLLRHQGGFDRSVSMDPTLTPGAVAREMGVDPPVTLDQIVGFMALQGLDYDPGSRVVYSNFGYAVLGRLVELITGEVYEAFIKEELLTPVGVRTMTLGRTFPDERPHDEVSYYHPPPPATVPAIPPETGEVPLPDGGFSLEIMAAHGGWIATPTDLLRLLGAVDGLENPPDILAPSMIHQMIAPPEEGVDTTYYAMGWMVRPERDGSPEAWWHAGDLPGTTALLMRSGRTSWALLLNRSPWGAQTHDVIREALESAARQVRRWPAVSTSAEAQTGESMNTANGAECENYDPAWSPDGRSLAFVRSCAGNAELYLVDAAGTNLVRLTETAGQEGAPAWAPDGTRLAYSYAAEGPTGRSGSWRRTARMRVP